MPNMDSLTKTKSYQTSLLLYFLISIGVGLQIGGSNWDIVWHGSRNVESFLTPPHTVIYSGVALSIASIIFRILFFFPVKINHNNRRMLIPNILKSGPILPFPIKLSIIGAILQITAGPFDFWWHTKFGFDGLLSPPHSILATGMLLISLGGVFGVYRHYKTNSLSFATRTCFVISCGIFLMVAVGMILLFTLPFSKGQYFDFNPEPFIAIFTAIILIPFVISLCLTAISSSSSSSSSKIPFIFTSITAVIIAIQSSATIISNSYFIGIFPFYLLNILPAIVVDIILLKYDNRKKSNVNNSSKPAKRYIFASMVLSLFFITIFFPWTADVFGGFFKPSSDIRTEVFLLQILFPIILPIVVPVSLFSAFIGGYTMQKLIKIDG
jgi:hypothetical protein